MINPRGNDGQINLYAADAFNLRFSTKVSTSEREVSVFLDGKTIQTATSGDVFVIPVNSTGLEPGIHNIMIQITDGNLQNVTKNVVLNILSR